MRTTISLDDRLLRQAKRLAADRGTSLSAVIADALRAQLAAARPREAHPFKLVTFRGDGPRAGVDLDRTSTIDEIDDIERFPRATGRADR